VAVVEGEQTNIKLTTSEDLEVLEALLREQEA
jgi:2-C-methyl-D-erythritol 4-phosphate cytidylyltransferase